jgi:hypothetical protein
MSLPQAIMFPLKSHASKSRTKGVIVIIWVVSTILAIPNAIAFRTVVSSKCYKRVYFDIEEEEEEEEPT